MTELEHRATREAFVRPLVLERVHADVAGNRVAIAVLRKRVPRRSIEASLDRSHEVPMSRFPSLPAAPGLADVFSAFPRAVWPLLEYHDTVLRGPSPLSVAERELLAAYVSTLNACAFCAGAHRIVAEVHGVDPNLLEGLLANPAHPEVDPRLRPLLDYVRKLTLAPSSVRDADADSVYAAGWTEQALFDAISVCALFNFMNRIVEGCGIVTTPEVQAEQRARHTLFRDDPETYRKFGRRLGLAPEDRRA